MAEKTHAKRRQAAAANAQERAPIDLVGKCANSDDATCLGSVQSFQHSIDDARRNIPALRESLGAADEVGAGIAAGDLRAALQHADSAIAEAAVDVRSSMQTVLDDVRHDAAPLLAHVPEGARPDDGRRTIGALCGPGHVSWEIPEQAPMSVATSQPWDEARMQVLYWLRAHVEDIAAAEARFRIDRRAIAAAIAWEALENWCFPRTHVPRPGWVSRAAGPGKVHYRRTFREGDTIARDVEQAGYLPQRTVDQRKALLRTARGSITYIAAIMAALADAVEESGRASIRSQPDQLTSPYQGVRGGPAGDGLGQWRAILRDRPSNTPLVAANPMALWTMANLDYLQDCVGPSGLTAAPSKQRQEGFEGYRKGVGYSTTVQVVHGHEHAVRINPAVYDKFAAMREAAKLEVSPERPQGIILELNSGARTNAEQKHLHDGWIAKQDSTIKNAGLKAHQADEHAKEPPLSAPELRRLQALRARAAVGPLTPAEQREARDLGWRYLSPAERAQLDRMLAGVFDRDTMYALAKALGKSADTALEHFNLAAKPGHSNHQDPLGSQAIDITGAKQANSAVYQWLRAHANEYGFIRTVPSENWHWEYRPGWTGYEHGQKPRRR